MDITSTDWILALVCLSILAAFFLAVYCLVKHKRISVEDLEAQTNEQKKRLYGSDAVLPVYKFKTEGNSVVPLHDFAMTRQMLAHRRETI